MRSIFFNLFSIHLLASCATSSLPVGENVQNTSDYCWNRILSVQGDPMLLDQALNGDINDYQLIVEELLVNREKTIRLIHQIDPQKPLSPAELDALHLRMKTAMELLPKISKLTGPNDFWIYADEERMKNAGLQPLDNALRLKGAMIGLSGSLLLYDAYLAVVAVINQDDRIRRVLNQSDIGYGIQEDQLAAISDDFVNFSNVYDVQDQIAFHRENIGNIPPKNFEDENFAYLDLLIQSSQSYGILDNLTTDVIISRKLSYTENTIRDNLNALNRTAVNGVSGAFGNAVGLVESRTGKLYDDKPVHDSILGQLQAGDILLEKTPFRLTDKLIPGHWGHAAIWIGSKEELIELEMWDHPLVVKYHQRIEQQRLIVEALRDGTTMNTLEHFLNIDDLLVLRKQDVSDLEKRKIIELALRQVGKPYDFNYDVETTDKIVCSQLVYLSYTDMEWPTDKVAGRYTISPDNIAQKALNGGQLEIVLLFSDGKEIQRDSEIYLSELIVRDL